MKYLNNISAVIIFLILLPVNIFSQSMNDIKLMPYPKEAVIKEGKFRINSNFAVAVKGNPGLKVFKAAARFLRHLDNRTGLLFWILLPKITLKPMRL
jgi:hypothetical protein